MTLNLHLHIIYLLRNAEPGKSCAEGAREAEKKYGNSLLGQATFGTLHAIEAGVYAQIKADQRAAEQAAKDAQDAEDKKNQENNIKTNQQNVRKDDRQEEELAKINGKDMSKMTREDVLSLSKDDIAKLSPSQKVALRAILMSKYLTASLDGGITPPDDVSAKMYDLELTFDERIEMAKSQAAAKYMDYANEQRMLGETPMSLEEYQNQDPGVAGWINAKSVRENLIKNQGYSKADFGDDSMNSIMSKGLEEIGNAAWEGIKDDFDKAGEFMGDVALALAFLAKRGGPELLILGEALGWGSAVVDTPKIFDQQKTDGQRVDAGVNVGSTATSLFNGWLGKAASYFSTVKGWSDGVLRWFTGKPTIPNVIDGKDTKDAKERIDDANIHLP